MSKENVESVGIPRLRGLLSGYAVYLNRSNDEEKELVATVQFLSLGIMYNLQRLRERNPKLYIVNV